MENKRHVFIYFRGKKQCAMPVPNFIYKNQLEGNKRWPISRKKLTFITYHACHSVCAAGLRSHLLKCGSSAYLGNIVTYLPKTEMGEMAQALKANVGCRLFHGFYIYESTPTPTQTFKREIAYLKVPGLGNFYSSMSCIWQNSKM